MPLKRWAFEAAAIAVALLILGYMLTVLVDVRNMTLPNGQPMFGDFTAFWSAGRMTLDGHVAEVHGRELIEQYQRAATPDVRYFAPYNSPPPFLFIACALALMPYAVSGVVFLISTFAFFLYAMRKLLPDNRALIFAATAPAVVYQAGTLQSLLLIAGINALSLHWLDKRPRLAGALVGLLIIKPHLAILWPIFLAFSRRWTAFIAASVSLLTLVLAAGLAFGFESYVRFFENLSDSQSMISGLRITTAAYASLYANLLSLGLPQTVASAAHAASAVAAVAIAARLFVRGNRAIAGAAFCAATLLISPYLFFYDFMLLMVGAALLGRPRDNFERAALILTWATGLTVVIGAYVALPLCPLAAWLVLIAAMRRAGSAAPRLAQAQHT